jgi:hypothetical protein
MKTFSRNADRSNINYPEKGVKRRFFTRYSVPPAGNLISPQDVGAILSQGGMKFMSHNKRRSFQGKMHALQFNSLEAENNVAGSTDRNRNQKGHVPNSPSTG